MFNYLLVDDTLLQIDFYCAVFVPLHLCFQHFFLTFRFFLKVSLRIYLQSFLPPENIIEWG